MRINVTGNAGSGKSTLSQKIFSELNLPLIEMDSLIREPGWKIVPCEVCRFKLILLIQTESWVVDGISHLARENADLIIFLDLPRRICAWRCAKRNYRYLFRSRPGLPEGCPEFLIIPTLINIIRKFPYQTRPAILKDIAVTGSEAIILKDATALVEFKVLISRLKTLYTGIRQRHRHH